MDEKHLNMETDAARQERRRRRAAALGAASSALSAASVAFCVLLSFSAAELRNRVADLEKPGADLDLLLEQKVSELLAQVNKQPTRRFRPPERSQSSSSITFQRSLDNYAKIRTARQTSPECNCPPGKLCARPCACASCSATR